MQATQAGSKEQGRAFQGIVTAAAAAAPAEQQSSSSGKQAFISELCLIFVQQYSRDAEMCV
jgi:hypothetical protein